MSNLVFVAMLAVGMLPLLCWAYKVLPREQWQILASIPSAKSVVQDRTAWQGSNITFYGFLLATGSLVGVVAFDLLMSAAGISLPATITLIGGVMLVSTLSAKFIARLVEKKKNTLTVAGAATVGLYLMPLMVWLANHYVPAEDHLSIMPVMAALATAYILGEGIGRLACISFGCCYGKPLAELGPIGQKIFSRFYTTFHGETKKIVYASGLAGVKVVPIQAITSFLYVSAGLVAMYLFLEGMFAASFGLAAIFSMAWRFVSEQLRADYRGRGRLTAYQIMGLINIGYCLFLLAFIPSDAGLAINLRHGVNALWNPGAIVFFQTLWVALFLYTGLSKVTGSTLTFHVNQENI